jgi:ATP-dependent RNA helicase RhlE
MRLRRAKIYAEAIHGDKSQSARQRTLDGFRNRQVNVLVATDIAARGIDVDHISHVVNFDLPREADTYIHRIGRTARAGAKGKAVSFCDSSERSLLRAIEKLVNRKIPVVQPKFEFVPEAAPEKSEAPRSEPYRKVTPNRQVAAPRSSGSSGSSGSAPGDYPRRGSKNKSQKTKYNKFKSSGGGGGNSGGNSGGGRPPRD